MSVFSFFQNLFQIKPKPKTFHELSHLEKADTIFNNLVAEGKLPGLSVTILKNGKSLLEKGYGYSNLVEKLPVEQGKTIFRIASISKCITGLAFGKMVEEGILNWDDSFYKYVPNYPKKEYDFNLRQLASHTAGIRGYRGKEYALNKPYSIEESIEVFKDDPLVFEPGKGYLYNSFDFVLLSLAMQEASGIPFQDYVQEKVLLPLGMKSTFTPLGDAEPVEASNIDFTERLQQTQSDTEFYTKKVTGFKKAMEVNNFYKLAGGGYLSTSADIAKMGQAILEGRLLRKETYEHLFNSQLINSTSTYYGLGFQVSEDARGHSFVGHVGNSVGAYTNFFVYPKENMVFSFLINCTDPKVQFELDLAINSVLSNSQRNLV